MGLLQNLWHGKGHEQWDQLARGLAETTVVRLKEMGDETPKPDGRQTIARVLDELEGEVRSLQAKGMNLFGFARLMKSYADALVMLGFPRDHANSFKKMLRQRVTLADGPAS